MTSKDHNYLKNVYLLSTVRQDGLGKVISTFDYNTTHKPELKKEVLTLLNGNDPDNKNWDYFLDPKYFNNGLKQVLDKLK